MTTPKQTIGALGEALAHQHLIESGYIVIAKNWRSVRGEIDIVAQKQDIIIFIEVKTRRTPNIDDAFMAFTPRKRDRVVNTIYEYLNDHNCSDCDWRFDFIAIALPFQGKPIINHMEGILDW